LLQSIENDELDDDHYDDDEEEKDEEIEYGVATRVALPQDISLLGIGGKSLPPITGADDSPSDYENSFSSPFSSPTDCQRSALAHANVMFSPVPRHDKTMTKSSRTSLCPIPCRNIKRGQMGKMQCSERSGLPRLVAGDAMRRGFVEDLSCGGFGSEDPF
jgi:hypothetical protein